LLGCAWLRIVQQAQSWVPDIMSKIAAEMAEIVRLAAAQGAQPGEGVKAAMRRAGRVLGLKHRRVKSLWYREVLRITAEEADALRAARIRILREHAARLDAELALLRARLSTLEATTACAAPSPAPSVSKCNEPGSGSAASPLSAPIDGAAAASGGR
jgi:hypothetical protein